METVENKKAPFDSPPETFTINEVAFMHQIIQACAQRGSFKPDEFRDVGVLNEKLKAMLDFAKQLEEQQKQVDEKKTEQVVDDISGSNLSA